MNYTDDRFICAGNAGYYTYNSFCIFSGFMLLASVNWYSTWLTFICLTLWLTATKKWTIMKIKAYEKYFLAFATFTSCLLFINLFAANIGYEWDGGTSCICFNLYEQRKLAEFFHAIFVKKKFHFCLIPTPTHPPKNDLSSTNMRTIRAQVLALHDHLQSSDHICCTATLVFYYRYAETCFIIFIVCPLQWRTFPNRLLFQNAEICCCELSIIQIYLHYYLFVCAFLRRRLNRHVQVKPWGNNRKWCNLSAGGKTILNIINWYYLHWLALNFLSRTPLPIPIMLLTCVEI